MTEPPSLSDQLRGGLGFLRRRWLVIVLVPAIAFVAAFAVVRSEQKKYDATSEVVVNPNNQITELLNPGAENTSPDPERDLNTEVSVITTLPLARRVQTALSLHGSEQDLLHQIKASVEGTTNIIAITARDPNPDRARALANVFAEQYTVLRGIRARRAFAQAATRVSDQLRVMTPGQRASDVGVALENRLRDLTTEATLRTGNAGIVQLADVPTAAATPRVKFDALLAVLLGLVLGVCAAALLELFDHRLRDDDEVAHITGAATLGSIPRPRRARRLRQNRTSIDREQLEGYRSLATSLQFFKLGGHVRTLLVTSPGPQDGKTSVTLALAGALAEFGHRVVAVECDLRRPVFAERLGLRPEPGLSAALAGLAPPLEQLVRLDANPHWRVESSPNGAGSVYVLPAGPPPPNPQALLGGAEMAGLMDDLRGRAEIVLIDTPPLGTITDAVPLVSQADGVALVVRLRHTTREALERTVGVLSGLRAPVLGTVLTASPRGALRYYTDVVPSSGKPVGVSEPEPELPALNE